MNVYAVTLKEAGTWTYTVNVLYVLARDLAGAIKIAKENCARLKKGELRISDIAEIAVDVLTWYMKRPCF